MKYGTNVIYIRNVTSNGNPHNIVVIKVSLEIQLIDYE